MYTIYLMISLFMLNNSCQNNNQRDSHDFEIQNHDTQSIYQSSENEDIKADIENNCPNFFEKNSNGDSIVIYRITDKLRLSTFKINDLYLDPISNKLFIIDYSDVHFRIFDLCENKILTSFMLDSKVKSVFRTTNENYLIVFLENDIETVWDVEMEMERLFMLDITSKEIDGFKLDKISW
jgi:hypothetical protein